jgi:hypothetical protein
MFYKVLTFEGIKFVPIDKVQSIRPIGRYFIIRYVDDGFDHDIICVGKPETASLEEMLDLCPKGKCHDAKRILQK